MARKLNNLSVPQPNESSALAILQWDEGESQAGWSGVQIIYRSERSPREAERPRAWLDGRLAPRKAADWGQSEPDENDS